MKKIMIVAAIALCAICSQAAQFKWNAMAIKDGYSATNPGTQNATGTAYLLFESVIAHDSVLSGIQAGTYTAASIADAATSSKALASGNAVVNTAFDFATAKAVGEMEQAYFVLFAPDGKSVYISSLAEAEVKATGAGTFAFGQQTASASATGWSSTSAAPEPTSGMLILLGVAGLALRRRRA